MRKIILLLSAAFIILFSCATTTPEVADTETEEKIAEPVEEKVVQTVIIDVYLVSMETQSASDSIVDGYKEYQYDEKGNLLEKRELDGEKKLLNRMVNEVSRNQIIKSQWFSGEENEPGNYLIKEYDGDNLIKETSFDIEDIPQSISTYEYNNNEMVKWTVSSGDNVPMMVTDYEYTNGMKSKATFLTPLGEMEGYIKYSWNGELIESEKTFDENDDLEKSIEYEYDDGNLIREIFYKKTVVDHTIEYELDENGNAITSKYLYRSGNLKSQIAYEYISVKREVQQ